MEKRIGLPFLSDRGLRAMTGNYQGGVGKHQKPVAERSENLRSIAARQVGASNRSGEESVSGQEQILPREMQANASWGVPRRVQNIRGQLRQTYAQPIFGEYIRSGNLRGGNPEPARLHVHHGEQAQIVLIQDYGRSGCLPQLDSASHMVDVGVGDDDLLYREAMLGQPRQNAGHVIARIDDHRLAGDFIAQDGAVALQRADRKGLTKHIPIVLSRPG